MEQIGFSIDGIDDPAEISPLLRASGLDPWRPEDGAAEVLVARRDDGRIVGCAVLMFLGDVGLLRSVAVAEDERRSGVGAAIVRRLLGRPAVRQLEAVYLLTTTAPGFFERLGFRAVERDLVSPVVQETSQYRTECPASAVVMRRP